MSYATVDELAAALRVRLTPDNEAGLQACLDAAAGELDHWADRPDDQPIDTDGELALANRITIARAVEWAKSNDAVFGAISFEAVGVLRAPKDGFDRWSYNAAPLKRRWGIA